MDTIKHPRDLPQTLFSIIIIVTLLCCAIWILHPFLLSVVWAGLIVIATWPLYTSVKRKLGGGTKLPIALMMLFLSATFLVPIVYSAGTLSTLLGRLLQWLMHVDKSHLPTLDFLARIPVVGEHLHSKWLALLHENAATFFATLKPWITKLVMMLAQGLSQFGALVANGLMMLLACLVFYLYGLTIARGLRQFAFRIAGERGDYAVLLAGKTVQAVAMGVVLTAVIQSAFAGLGMAICQIPSSGLLTGIIFVLCLMQLGPVIIMLPALIWLFYQGEHWNGVLLLIWTVVAGSLDNILKPILIKRGADTSLLLIMTGVIGGMLTWGMIGLMIGPVLLAVSWTLLSAWVSEANYQPLSATKEL
ncbi:AI-2E family transporter YdiK [Enterobacteriaceae bacterium RIT714]|nr:AI-2E family transporter YdiK [Enterobacteriaceae bacterium RIT714]